MEKVNQKDRSRITTILAESNNTLADLDGMPIKGSRPVVYVPTSGIIEYRPASKKINLNNFSFGVSYDNETGIAYGIPLGVNKEGQIRWRRIQFNGTKVLDLSKPAQRLEHFIIMHSPYVKGGINAGSNQPKLELYDPERAAQQIIAARKSQRKADEIIDLLADDEVADFAVLFGINRNNSIAIMRMQLLEKAANRPQDIVARYDDPDRAIWTLVKNGLFTGVLQESPAGVFFGGVNLGARKPMAVEELKKNGELAAAIDIHVKERIKAPAVKPGERRKSPPKLSDVS